MEMVYMLRRMTVLTVGLVSLAATLTSQGALITTWDFTGFVGGAQGAVVNYPSPGYTTKDPSVSSASLAANPLAKTTVQALNPGYSGISMRFTESNNGHSLGGNFILTITPATGYTLSAFSITYYARSSIATSDTWAYSVNGGSSWTSASAQPVNISAGNTWNQYTVNFTAFSVSSGSVQFRDLFTSTSQGTADFDNINLYATVVPEPVNVALAAFGLCVVGVGVGRRIYLRARA